ncbi:MAG: Zn-dependent exopeptidase M28 [Ruminococcaceae bacterium]|nr:Zn-dependent exopeptidase M28 [Oscillospiraceae bacterium]
MTSISEEILEKYQVRKTRKQKTAFIEYLRAHFPEIKVEEDAIGYSRNIVIGNPDTAKVVFGAHYDTCAVMPIPNFIMPKSVLVSVLYTFVLVIPMLIIGSVVGGAAGYLFDDSNATALFTLITYWAILFLMILGPANKHTVNDNTSGVITLIELMNAMTEEERAQSCFVFFDNEEKGLFGSSTFAKEHKKVMKDKLLINFDCVSDGDYLMLILNKKAFPEHFENIKAAFADVTEKNVLIEKSKFVYYPSDQKNFKKNIGVAAFKKSKLGLYMDRIHTPRDTIMDERNIAVLTEGIIKFLKTI